MACVSPAHPDRRKCERLLGVVGAQLFLDFIALSGMPTGRLFTWAQLFQAGLNPKGRGVGEGKLARTDISKWKKLVQPEGKTDRVRKDAGLEFTIADFTLAAAGTQVHVLLAFERKSETLLIYTNPGPIDPLAMVARVLELARAAAEKLQLPMAEPRRNVLWMANPDIYRQVRESLCRTAGNALSADGAGSAQAGGRKRKLFEWKAQKMLVYPDDWTCELLPLPVPQAVYAVPGWVSLAKVRRKLQDFIIEFNHQGRPQSRGKEVSPSILHQTRRRDVEERLSV